MRFSQLFTAAEVTTSMDKRLLVFSVDAMVYEDLAYLSTRPNFKAYLDGSAQVKRVRSIYPTVTYPIHVSLLTGCYPERHGVFSNFAFTTGSKEETWQWFASAIQVEDIFTVAKRASFSTGSVFWPVTGCHPSIDYLLNEYWMPLPTDTLEGAFKRSGTSDEVLAIVDRNRHLLPPSHVKTGRVNVMVEPFIDDFLIACACDVIRRFKPQVMFVHNGIIDGTRHKTGVFNEHVTAALDQVDMHLGRLMRSLEEAGVLQDTNIVFLSDHGQMDFDRIIKPNVLLAQNGFIDVAPNGMVLDWRAYCMSNAMSAMVFLREPDNRTLYNQVYTLLRDLANEGAYGFSQVFTREEIRAAEHLDGDFSFVLETDGRTSFSDDCMPPILSNVDLTDFRLGYATHGYLPDKGPQPVFVAKGPAFQNGKTLDRRPIVDVAPTLAEVLGLELPEAQGVSMTELLR